MKKIGTIILTLLFTLPAWAEINIEPLLNKITLQLHGEQWVTTKTALVTVGINASVSDQNIDKIQSEVMDKLSKLSNKGEWHMVSFNRQQDKSGLENIQMIAEARLLQPDLAGLRDRAKSISKAGETFTIDNVQFVPSEDELRQANTMLRNNIYQQIKVEIDALNKAYPEQKYYLHQIDFIIPQPIMNPGIMNAMVKTSAPNASPLSVGNKQELQAMVVLSSMSNLPTPPKS